MRANDVYEEIGRHLRQAREEAGLSQEQLAERIGMSGAGYSRWETGRLRVPIYELQRIARILGKPASWFIGEETDQERLFDWRLGDLTEDEQQIVSDLVESIRRRRQCL